MRKEDDWLAQQMREEGYHPLAGQSRAAKMLQEEHDRKCKNKHMKTAFKTVKASPEETKKIMIFLIGFGVICLIAGAIVPAIIIFSVIYKIFKQ